MKKWLARVLELDVLIASAALAGLIAVTFLGVIMRYWYNSPFIWLEEVQVALIVWVVFMAGGAAFRTGSHVSIEMLVDKFPRRLRIAIGLIVAVLTVLLLLYMMRASIMYISLLSRAGRVTNLLKIPLPLVYSVFPLGCLLMIFNYLYTSLPRILSGETGAPAEEGE